MLRFGFHSRSSASVSSNPHLLSHQPLPGSSIFCPSLAFVSKLLNMRHLMLYVLVTPNENVNIFSGLPSCNSSSHSRHYYSVTNHLWHSSLPCMDSLPFLCIARCFGWLTPNIQLIHLHYVYSSSPFHTLHSHTTFPGLITFHLHPLSQGRLRHRNLYLSLSKATTSEEELRAADIYSWQWFITLVTLQ